MIVSETSDKPSVPTITAVIIARNEAEMIANCIETLRWCDEILVIDNGSDDATPQIAEELGARVVSFQTESFAQLRNKALKYIKTDWLIYIDADERVTPQLSQEIAVHMETGSSPVLQMNRKNICYGHFFEHGGWEHEVMTRAFKKSALKEWSGDIHESAQYEGEPVLLHAPLVHLTHRDVVSGLVKSSNWTPIEARLLAESDQTPQVSGPMIIKKGVAEIVRRLIFKKGYKDGTAGWVEAITQGINRMLVYMQVWELQQEPSISDQYKTFENDIADAWKRYHQNQQKKQQ